MNESKIYVKAAEQISIQTPLCEDWIDTPIVYDSLYNNAIDPNFKEFLSAGEARRLGKILKRAVATSLTAIKKTGIEHPDAIITSTGLGCIANTELFLTDLCNVGEQFLKPTLFMQSTHNTISSLVAIITGSHGYNITYAHKGISFDSALLDAYTQISLGDIKNVLVGAHDEMTASYFTLLQRIKYLGVEGMVSSGETAVSVMLDTDEKSSLCHIGGMKLMYKPSAEEMRNAVAQITAGENIDAIMVGVNNNPENDAVYNDILAQLAIDSCVLQYKNIFGESYTSSALGFYAASHCLSRGCVPQFMRYGNSDMPESLRNILLINHADGKDISFVLLKK